MPVHSTREEIIWDGRVLPHSALTWGQEFTGGMPESVAVSASSGSVWGGSATISLHSGVAEVSPSPWNGRYPTPGDRLTIRVFVDEVLVKTFTPIVDSVTFSQDEAKIEFISSVDTFSRPVRLPPLTQDMPATPKSAWWNGRVTGEFRHPAPSPIWAISECMRAAGYYPTPKVQPGCILDITCQGAYWANTWWRLGEITRCISLTPDVKRSPNYRVEGGINYFAHGRIIADMQRPARGDWQASFMVKPTVRDTGEVELTGADPDGNRLKIIVNADRSLRIIAGRGEVTAHISAREFSGYVVSVVCKGGRLEVKAGSALRVLNAPTFALEHLKARVSDGGGIAGIQAYDSAAAGHAVAGFEPTGIIRFGHWLNMSFHLPSIRDRSARAVLDEIAAATLSSWWVDGAGICHFESAEYLLAKRPTATLRASDDIASYQIAEELIYRKADVTCEYAELAGIYSRTQSVTVWEGGGTGNRGDVSQTFIEPDEEEEWINPEYSFRRISGDNAGFNTRSGSWWGASKPGAKYDSPTLPATQYTISTRMVTPWLLLLEERFGEDATKEVYESPLIRRSLHGKPTPILRAQQRIQRRKARISKTNEKDQTAGSLVVQAYPWIDREAYAQQMVDFLAPQVFAPLPALRSLPVRYSPALEVGDMVRVIGGMDDGSQNLFGAVLNCSVQGVQHAPDAGTSSLTLKTVTVVHRFQSWDVVEEAVARAGLTWDRVEARARELGISWAQLERDPLGVIERIGG